MEFLFVSPGLNPNKDKLPLERFGIQVQRRALVVHAEVPLNSVDGRDLAVFR